MLWRWRRASQKSSWLLSEIKSGKELVGTCLLLQEFSGRKRDWPYLVYLTIRYQGTPLPFDLEFDRFSEVEDLLSLALEPAGFIIVGTMTMNGKRDWICYAREPEAMIAYLRPRINEAQFEIVHDPTWSQYRGLLKMNR